MRTAILADTAIQGGQHAWHLQSYFSDRETELWGMNMLMDLFPWWDRWFEIHVDYLGDASLAYRNFLRHEHDRPIYMLRKEEDIPSSVAYPLADVVKGVSNAYFTSTRAYMIALAIHERFDRIVVLGTGEAQTERSSRSTRNVAFWLGVAAGRGIEIIPDAREGALRSYAGDSADLLYGYRLPLEEAMRPGAIDDMRRSVQEAAKLSGQFNEDILLGR